MTRQHAATTASAEPLLPMSTPLRQTTSLPSYAPPRLNGKVERAHRIDAKEFHQISTANSSRTPTYSTNASNNGRTTTTSTDHTADAMDKPLRTTTTGNNETRARRNGTPSVAHLLGEEDSNPQ